MRGSSDELAWPAATAVFTATADTRGGQPTETEAFQLRRQKDRIDESAAREAHVGEGMCGDGQLALGSGRAGGACDTERLAVGCTGDVSRQGDGGLLTAGAHGHTTTLIAPQTGTWK